MYNEDIKEVRRLRTTILVRLHNYEINHNKTLFTNEYHHLIGMIEALKIVTNDIRYTDHLRQELETIYMGDHKK